MFLEESESLLLLFFKKVKVCFTCHDTQSRCSRRLRCGSMCAGQSFSEHSTGRRWAKALQFFDVYGVANKMNNAGHMLAQAISSSTFRRFCRMLMCYVNCF